MRWTWTIDAAAVVGLALICWGLDVLGTAIGVGPALMLLALGGVLSGGALWTGSIFGRTRKCEDRSDG